MKCESCIYAIWDYFEYFGGAKQPFVYGCTKGGELTMEEEYQFFKGNIEQCGMYVEVDDGFGD